MKLRALATLVIVGASSLAAPTDPPSNLPTAGGGPAPGVMPSPPAGALRDTGDAGPPPPEAAQKAVPWTVTGKWHGDHDGDWDDTVTILPDGTFSRTEGDAGRWTLTTLQDHIALVLAWDDWPAETLTLYGPSDFRSKILELHRIDQPGGGPAPAPETSSTGSGWMNQGIGSFASVGSFAETDGTFTINGSGTDIWNAEDGFRFIYQAIDGDCTVTARVLNIENTSGWAKAGVMIRESLAPNSACATALVTPTQGFALIERSTAGTSSKMNSNPGGIAPPYWVRLIRSGGTIIAFISPDGANWTASGATTVSMESKVYVGLAVCGAKNGALCQAQFDNVTLTKGASLAPGKTLGGLTAGRVETHTWRQGEPPVRLIRQEEGFCALSLVTGHFQGGGEVVRLYVGDDGYWYLGGQSGQEGVAAQCIVVRYAR